MNELLAKVDPRSLWLALGGCLVISALAGYSFSVRPLFVELTELREARLMSSLDVASGKRMVATEQLAVLRNEIARLNQALNGDELVAPSQMVTHVIRVLDELSEKHGVELRAVTPGPRTTVLTFAEIPFEVEVQGDYFALFRWLGAAEKTLRPMAMKHFEMRPVDATTVALRLRVVAYRTEEKFGS